VGRPNAGKSTLVNALVQEKVAIVSDKPQTTRKRILGVARRPDCEIALVDTPGIHRPKYKMNAAMVREATGSLSTADAILFVVDAADERGPGEAFILELVARAGTPARIAREIRQTVATTPPAGLPRYDWVIAHAWSYFKASPGP
jgi:GTP-binding protein Era